MQLCLILHSSIFGDKMMPAFASELVLVARSAGGTLAIAIVSFLDNFLICLQT